MKHLKMRKISPNKDYQIIASPPLIRYQYLKDMIKLAKPKISVNIIIHLFIQPKLEIDKPNEEILQVEEIKQKFDPESIFSKLNSEAYTRNKAKFIEDQHDEFETAN